MGNQRNVFWLGFAAWVIVAALAIPDAAQATPPTTLTLAHVYPAKDVRGETASYWAKLVEKKTGGKLKASAPGRRTDRGKRAFRVHGERGNRFLPHQQLLFHRGSCRNRIIRPSSAPSVGNSGGLLERLEKESRSLDPDHREKRVPAAPGRSHRFFRRFGQQIPLPPSL